MKYGCTAIATTPVTNSTVGRIGLEQLTVRVIDEQHDVYLVFVTSIQIDPACATGMLTLA